MIQKERYFPWSKLIVILLVIFLAGSIYGVISLNFEVSNYTHMNLSSSAIFNNNILVIISLLVIGTLTSGFYTIFVLFVNGMIVGKTLFSVYLTSGFLPILTGFLPHAIPELLSIFISSSISVIPFYLFAINKKELHLSKIYKEIFVMLILSFALCGLGALVEGIVSTH
ncbi:MULTISPECIES: stage II sporulation protein M [Bacillus]|uniref:Stage II sporulation protein M n=2 Tax=Bacillus TaxID=1386 RepID=A0A0M4GBR9_9BACI|nr:MULTISPECIES: stage II sporulation protein M [Bacillus]ALC83220.1 hypothetical protein AM592_17885 [Bacillus gobiensis]MBP1084218.1 putative membrane protein SpoIIM required for sporulation [Bacillus capparidis]MED1094666.1 stage II sporulation protein M [Bacillus capparidis]